MLDCSAEPAPGLPPREPALPGLAMDKGTGSLLAPCDLTAALPPGPGLAGEPAKRPAEPGRASSSRGEAEPELEGRRGRLRPAAAEGPPRSQSRSCPRRCRGRGALSSDGAGRGQHGPDGRGAVLRCHLPILLAGV